MNDRILAKTITRALLKVIADLTPRTDEARYLMATLLTDATLKAVGGCPKTAIEVAQLLFEVRQEIEAERAGTAVPVARTPNPNWDTSDWQAEGKDGGGL